MQSSRRLPFFTLAAAAVLSLASASILAQTPAALAAPADSVRIHVSAPYLVSAQETNDIAHPYRLSNDQVLVVREQNQHFYGYLSDLQQRHQKPEVEIFPTAPGVFVTRRGATIAFSDAGAHVAIDDAQHLPGLRVPADVRTAMQTDGTLSVRLVSK